MSAQMIKGNTGEFSSPSPYQGEGGVGVTSALSVKNNPHPNLPPKSGKEQAVIYRHQERDQKLKKFSRALRKNMTDAERKLWRVLKQEQQGVKFRRQYPIGEYIVDFVCLEKAVVIELDGGQHAAQEIYDRKRDRDLEAKGFKVLRFWNNDVMENLEGVVARITPTLTLPLAGGGNLS